MFDEITEWGCPAKLTHKTNHHVKKKKLLRCVQFFVTPWTVDHQAPLSMEFSRCNRCNFPGGAGHNFWKNDIAQRQNINQLESNGTKMADKTRPWSSISKWNDTPRGALTVPRHCQKPRSGRWPKSWKSPPLPQNSWTNPSTHLHMKLPSLLEKKKNCGVGEDSWESLGLQGNPTSPS